MNFAWDPQTLGNDRKTRPVHGEKRPMNFAWDEENDPTVAMFAGAKVVGTSVKAPETTAKMDNDVFNQQRRIERTAPTPRPAAPEWWPNDRGVGKPLGFEMETRHMEECDIDADAVAGNAEGRENRPRDLNLAENLIVEDVDSADVDPGSRVFARDPADEDDVLQSSSSPEKGVEGTGRPEDPVDLGEVATPMTPMGKDASLAESARLPLEGVDAPAEQAPPGIPREDEVDAAVRAVDRALERVRRRKSQDKARRRSAMAEQQIRQSTAERMRERRKNTPKPWRYSPYKPSASQRKDASPACESPLTRNKIYVDAPSAHDRSRRSTTYSRSFSYGW